MESLLTISVTLLAVGVLLLLLLLLAALRACGSLQRVERLLAERDAAPPVAPATAEVAEAERPANAGAFREFLNEDSARRKLPKREQFEAFRLWRKEKGLNWGRP